MTKLANLIDAQWRNFLSSELESHHFQKLEKFLSSEYKDFEVYPPKHTMFNALNLIRPDKVKVVILGQDPYHGEGQANGLAFSVHPGIKLPPSLRNIYKELESDLQVDRKINGDLTDWAQQGILLLNTVLTVRKSEANSHRKKGWEFFTDQIIKVISEKSENVVFVLWGSPAHKKEKFIDSNKHLILKSVHPSPLSSYRGFFGSKPFSQTNIYLKSKKKKEIIW